MLILHVGAPRTGSTVLQKNIFKESENTTIISKNPFEGGVPEQTNQKGATSYNPNSLISLSENCIPKKTSNNPYIFSRILALTQSIALAKTQQQKDYQKALELKLNEVIEQCIHSSPTKDILISSERLLNTTGSVMCNSDIGKTETEFNIFTLVKSIKNKTRPLITICLRDPIPHLRSRYFRNKALRENAMLRPLTPSEYIKKQATLERKYPFSSSIAASMHAKLITELQKHCFVKAFGFQDLINSHHVLELIGLHESKQVRFKDFQKENATPIKTRDVIDTEESIVAALKETGLHAEIANCKLFD